MVETVTVIDLVVHHASQYAPARCHHDAIFLSGIHNEHCLAIHRLLAVSDVPSGGQPTLPLELQSLLDGPLDLLALNQFFNSCRLEVQVALDA